MARSVEKTGIFPIYTTDQDLYGRTSLPGMRLVATNGHAARRARKNDAQFYHRTKNGVRDAMTFYHIVDTLLRIPPDRQFRTKDLSEVLTATKHQLVWDNVTIGRVVTEIAENLKEANGITVIEMTRRWNGGNYSVSSRPEERVILLNLLQDLEAICVGLVKDECIGIVIKRDSSPLLLCPSVMAPARALPAQP
jgi:hypothetical protein